jgi:hypothetical protein
VGFDTGSVLGDLLLRVPVRALTVLLRFSVLGSSVCFMIFCEGACMQYVVYLL